MNEPILFLDFETRSACDIKSSGADVYAEHPSTEILCVGVAWNDSEKAEVSPAPFAAGDWTPKFLMHVALGGKVVAHNAAFELAIWNSIGVQRHGWPVLRPEQIYCTMAMARALALPGSLENAAAAAGIEAQKDMKGRRVMLQLAQPREVLNGIPVWWELSEFPEKYEILYAYCAQDVEVERELYRRLLPLSTREREVWLTDYEINRRGIKVDTEVLKVAQDLVSFEKGRLDAQMERLTDGLVPNCRAISHLKNWLAVHQNVQADKLAKADVAALLALPDLPQKAKKAIELRQKSAKSSTAKIDAMLSRAGSDGRIRGIAIFCGASTGRWSGSGVQFQNLPRPKLKQKEIDQIFSLLGTESRIPVIHETIETFFGSPMQVMSDCIRGFVVPEKGKVFLGADFSAIEARVVAWLAGEERVLDIFRGHGKIYEYAASGIYGVPLERVDENQRQIGKVAVLALGFGGGVGAFQNMARAYGVKLSDAEADQIKNEWRKNHPHIVQYWRDLEDAARTAILDPGVKYSAGAPQRQVAYLVKGDFLFCRLPSGRVLSYPRPRIVTEETKFGVRDVVKYRGETQQSKWGDLSAWGGLLCENVTQAVSACLLRDAIIRVEERGFPVVMHVHDEIVTEVPEGFGSIEQFERLMCETREWAKGLPVKASGFLKRRYGK